MHLSLTQTFTWAMVCEKPQSCQSRKRNENKGVPIPVSSVFLCVAFSYVFNIVFKKYPHTKCTTVSLNLQTCCLGNTEVSFCQLVNTMELQTRVCLRVCVCVGHSRGTVGLFSPRAVLPLCCLAAKILIASRCKTERKSLKGEYSKGKKWHKVDKMWNRMRQKHLATACFTETKPREFTGDSQITSAGF